MKVALSVIAVAALVGSCFNSGNVRIGSGDNVIEYQVSDNEYAVVIVQEKGMSEGAARKAAKQRAAELTVEHGYRYFTIEKEQKTQVVQSDKSWPDNKGFYNNMYQELIIEEDFGRASLARQGGPSAQTYPATRVVFKMFVDKPAGKSYNACNYTDCSK
jgi:hypothetical protein